MFDRFSGVKDQVWFQLLLIWNVGGLKGGAQATGEGTHFLVPWLQRAILYDCRIKPRVSSLQLEAVREV
jgi:prohibitin 1